MSATALRRLFGLALLGLVAAAWAIRDRFDADALQAWVDSAGAAGRLSVWLHVATRAPRGAAAPMLRAPQLSAICARSR